MGRFFRVIRALIRDQAVARVTAAFTAFVVAEYAVWIGMLVYAFQQGGTTAAGLVAFAQLAPGMLLAPVMATLADRRSPTELLVGGYLVQALGMAGVAVSMWANASPYAAYGLAVLASTAMTTTRPAQFTLLPALARDAQQLTAANVVASWAENAGMLIAALVAALFLGIGQIGTLFAVCAGLVAGAAVLVAPVRVAGIALAGGGAGADGEPGGLRMVLDGAREVGRERRPRLLVSLLTAQFVVVGSLDVLFVVLAIQVLGRGPGVGRLPEHRLRGGGGGGRGAHRAPARPAAGPVADHRRGRIQRGPGAHRVLPRRRAWSWYWSRWRARAARCWSWPRTPCCSGWCPPSWSGGCSGWWRGCPWLGWRPVRCSRRCSSRRAGPGWR